MLIKLHTIFSPLPGSRKYPDPHHRENWKFQGGGGGGGGSKAHEIPEGMGVGGCQVQKLVYFILQTSFQVFHSIKILWP